MQIKDQFFSLCEQFINLDRLVSQDFLEDLDRSFRGMLSTYNQTIFPNMTQGLKQIQDKFLGYKFNNEKMKNLFEGSMSTLMDFGDMMVSAK